MTYQRFHATFVGVVAALADSIVVAELAGYWLHRLLHSSDALLYRPDKPRSRPREPSSPRGTRH